MVSSRPIVSAAAMRCHVFERDSAPSSDDLADDIFADPKPAEPDPDPLEETPDFLQETPEHDRLWFEQKPPRDFDFDK